MREINQNQEETGFMKPIKLTIQRGRVASSFK